jgi:putative ABC transport system permease protein
MFFMCMLNHVTDEPTSALDPEATAQVERALCAPPALARVWVSHDPQQPSRVGGSVFDMRAHALKPVVSNDDPDSASDIATAKGSSINDGGAKLGSATSITVASEPKSKNKTSAPTASFAATYLWPLVLTAFAVLIMMWQQFDWPGYSWIHSGSSGPTPTPAPGGAPANVSAFLICGAFGAVVLVTFLISSLLGLELTREMTIAAARSIIQLTLLGILLVPIFKYNRIYIVLPYLFFMTCVATYEVLSRVKFIYPLLGWHVLFSVGGSVSASAAAGLASLGEGASAQYAIPIVGMLLGNLMTGLSLNLNTLLCEFSEQARDTEVLLALGATRWEAAAFALRRAISVAITPTVQAMAALGAYLVRRFCLSQVGFFLFFHGTFSVMFQICTLLLRAGVVSIPGMMTGQILGGTVPEQAARYQMMIYLLITVASLVGMLLSSLFAVVSVLDDEHCLRTDRLRPKKDFKHPWRVLFRG